MSTEKTITVKAADGALTIAELRRFVEEFDKAADPKPPGAGVPAVNGLKPKARVSFGGHLKSITVKVQG
jgi:hypothetical protein